MSVDDGLAALKGVVDVPRETVERLAVFVELLKKWQKVENLVSPGTLSATWRRHVADSAQLLAIFPGQAPYLDLGSGAGFPGLVVAIAGGVKVDLIEANQRKSGFLREAIRQTGASAAVHSARIEVVLAKWPSAPAIISSRALAPLTELLSWAKDLVGRGSRCAFHKGREFAAEVAVAREVWDFDLVTHPSLVDSDGVILEVTRIAAKER